MRSFSTSSAMPPPAQCSARLSCSFANSSSVYPSTLIITSSVSWPSSGAGLLTIDGVRLMCHGGPVCLRTPTSGCSNSTKKSRSIELRILEEVLVRRQDRRRELRHFAALARPRAHSAARSTGDDRLQLVLVSLARFQRRKARVGAELGTPDRGRQALPLVVVFDRDGHPHVDVPPGDLFGPVLASENPMRRHPGVAIADALGLAAVHFISQGFLPRTIATDASHWLRSMY